MRAERTRARAPREVRLGGEVQKSDAGDERAKGVIRLACVRVRPAEASEGGPAPPRGRHSQRRAGGRRRAAGPRALRADSLPKLVVVSFGVVHGGRRRVRRGEERSNARVGDNLLRRGGGFA